MIKTLPAECPECGSVHIVKHKKHNRMMWDLNEEEHCVGNINIHGHGYQCKECGNTFDEELSCVDKSGKLNKRLIAKIRLKCFDKIFKDMADEYGIPQFTVKRIFEDWADELSESYMLYSLQILGIDEVHFLLRESLYKYTDREPDQCYKRG